MVVMDAEELAGPRVEALSRAPARRGVVLDEVMVDDEWEFVTLYTLLRSMIVFSFGKLPFDGLLRA